jgi:hypothetical protein
LRRNITGIDAADWIRRGRSIGRSRSEGAAAVLVTRDDGTARSKQPWRVQAGSHQWLKLMRYDTLM